MTAENSTSANMVDSRSFPLHGEMRVIFVPGAGCFHFERFYDAAIKLACYRHTKAYTCVLH